MEINTDQDPKNIVSQPPLTTPLLDQTGRASRAWAIWFRDLYTRTAYKGGNAIDNNLETIEEVVAQVLENIDNINANALAIQQNSTDIAANAQAIIDNASAISALTLSLNSHVSASQAHGSNGDIVGFNDLATEVLVGLVKRMASISDAVDSTIDITTPDIGAAPAAYNQAYTQSVTDLTNENKAAINQLASDLNAAIGVLNNLLAQSKSSGQMTTP